MKTILERAEEKEFGEFETSAGPKVVASVSLVDQVLRHFPKALRATRALQPVRHSNSSRGRNACGSEQAQHSTAGVFFLFFGRGTAIVVPHLAQETMSIDLPPEPLVSFQLQRSQRHQILKVLLRNGPAEVVVLQAQTGQLLYHAELGRDCPCEMVPPKAVFRMCLKFLNGMFIHT